MIEYRLRHETTILDNQFSFMPKWSTHEAIFLFRCLMEKFIEACKNFNMVSIDLEEANERILKRVMWWVLEKKGVHLNYIKLIKDINDEVVTSVKTTGGITISYHYMFVSRISIKSISLCTSDGLAN